MASLDFKLYTFSVLVPDDGGRQPKYIGGNIICIGLYILYEQLVGFLIKEEILFFPCQSFLRLLYPTAYGLTYHSFVTLFYKHIPVKYPLTISLSCS
jgi:hypothetical protein